MEPAELSPSPLSMLEYYGKVLRHSLDMLVEKGLGGSAVLLAVNLAVTYGILVFIQAFTMWMLSEYLGVRGEEFWRSVLAALTVDLSAIIMAILIPGAAAPLLGVAGGLLLGSLAASKLYRAGLGRAFTLCLAGLVVVLILPVLVDYAGRLPLPYRQYGS